jgi:hypothetical protein
MCSYNYIIFVETNKITVLQDAFCENQFCLRKNSAVKNEK